MIPAQELRRLFGTFAAGVTVVTTTDGGDPVGVTVNAFASLSLDPPLVLVCLHRANRSYASFERAEAFAVNVLAREQEPLARRFASPDERKFARLRYRAGERTGAPLLDGVHAWMECTVAERFAPPGTHAVIVGEVVAHGSRDAQPLIYYRSRYRTVGAPAS